MILNYKFKILNSSRGMATLEMLIAMALIVLVISYVLPLVSGSQSTSVDSQTNQEALYKAQALLEDARATSRQDYSLVQNCDDSTATQCLGILDPFYNRKLTIDPASVTSCGENVKSSTSWLTDNRNLSVNLTTRLGDLATALALGGDCDVNPLSEEWDNPVSDVSIGIGGAGATDIDVRNNLVYLTSTPSASATEDFFVYEFNPTLLSLTELGKKHVSLGLNGVDAINDYAFTINNDTSDHLIVFDVSNPLNPTPFAPVSLPNMTTGIARSIFYYNNFVYIGTQYLACPPPNPPSWLGCTPLQNNEFHIFDVSTPSVPIWRGSFKVNHNINDIVVRGDYAYLATSDDSGEVYIYDVSNPSSISFEGSFDASGDEDGNSLYFLGNKLYLGRYRTPAGRKDFYILDILNPSNPTELGSKNLGLSPGPAVRVTGIAVKGNLAFVGLDNPTSGLRILNISNPSSIVDHPICTTLNFSENSTAMDMDGDFVFSANDSNDEIRIIRDQASVCP